MISMDKKYQTRDGDTVRLLCTDRDNEVYPVVAIVRGNVELYKPNGSYHSSESESGLDLVELPDTDMVDVYVGLFKWGTGTDAIFFRRKSSFDNWLSETDYEVVATTKITVKLTHGEFYGNFDE